MIKTAADLSPAEIEKYARGAKERARASHEQLEARRLCVWELARKAASLLKEQFKARRVVDRKVPSGADWHRRLLAQMTEELPDTCPAVIATETFHCLDEYRSFRHVVRNIYAFNLRSAHLEELVVGLRSCHDAIKRDITAFIEFLKRLAYLDDQADSHQNQ